MKVATSTSVRNAVVLNRCCVADALTAWTESAVDKLREKWAGDEDEEAAKSPGDPEVQGRLKLERDEISSAVGSLESFQER